MNVNTKYGLKELDLESRLGAEGTESNDRTIPVIDLGDFENRKEEITEQLWDAAVNYGFFQLSGHGFSREDVNQAFQWAEKFFALPGDIKAQYPLRSTTNVGWEYMGQVRPSTRLADQKESYQITLPKMEGMWPTEEELPGFRKFMLDFEHRSWSLGMQVLSCFANRLGFPGDFFIKAHDPGSDTYKSTLRLLHYFAQEPGKEIAKGSWRAGAHTDFDCLTLLFQKDGQGGLQVCPGREAESGSWTPVIPSLDLVTCNIGDMLMRWSDDELRSTLHRVRMPSPDELTRSRYSMAFFCQANCEQVIQGPKKKYEPISAEDYLNQRISANFAALQESGKEK